MTRKRPTCAPDLAALASSWEIALGAERKSPQTIKAYTDGVRYYLTWCDAQGSPALERDTLRAWVSSLLDEGRSAATARSRQLAVRRFSAWLAEEGVVAADPLLGLKPPKLDDQVLEPLTDDELRAMLDTCRVRKGTPEGEAMWHRRDAALIRFMAETGARAGEVVALELTDLDLKGGTAVVRRGKGGKGRLVPFGPATGVALDRYLRARAFHRLARTSPMLWLGDRGKEFSYDALHKTLSGRANAAGIERFKPHLLRHTAAHRWLAAGGSEAGLLAVAGWTRPDMLMRYTKARATDRAIAESRSLNLGEL